MSESVGGRRVNGQRLAIATLGGPTAVLNATVEGFMLEARHYGQAVGVRDGPMGLAAGQFCELEGNSGFIADVKRPGSWLAAGRHLLSDDEIDGGLQRLAAQGVSGLAVVGGNGTMAYCQRLLSRAESIGIPVRVVGVPKTIDNDLCGTDHSPGFASAATFVVEMVTDLAFDHRAMRSIEQVRIIETLGRNSGWLALSSLLARRSTGSEPHLVYLPERPFDEGQFLDQVNQQVSTNGQALVVVAEGAAANLVDDRFERVAFDRPIEGGVARVLADRLRDALGLTVRAEVPGLIQRCSSRHVSVRDRREAAAVGGEAARLLASGHTGVMVTLGRHTEAGLPSSAAAEGFGSGSRPNARSDGDLGKVRLSDVAGRTRRVPPEWVPASAAADSPAFVAWLAELLSSEMMVCTAEAGRKVSSRHNSGSLDERVGSEGAISDVSI